MSKILRVKITGGQSGWKGTWYQVGEKHFVVKRVESYLACSFHAVDHPAGIHESDCVVLSDVTSRILCALKAIKIWLKIQNNYGI